MSKSSERKLITYPDKELRETFDLYVKNFEKTNSEALIEMMRYFFKQKNIKLSKVYIED